MSKFVDKLKQVSQGGQPIGFRAAATSKPRMLLVAAVVQAEIAAGADAGLLVVAKGSGAKALERASKAVPDIPWGCWLQDGAQGEIQQILKTDCDFVVFPSTTTPLATLQNNEEVGKILEVEASLNEGLLRAVNELPVDAVIITTEQRENYPLTWHHLMLFRRFADLLTKPLLVTVPLDVTANELKGLWESGVSSAVVDVKAGQSKDRFKELRQEIDNLAFPSPRRHEKMEPLLPRTSQDSGAAETGEEWEEE